MGMEALEEVNIPKFNPTKAKDAEKEYKAGKKAISTSLFKWSADYLAG